MAQLLFNSNWLLLLYDFDEVVHINYIQFYIALEVFLIVVHAGLFMKFQCVLIGGFDVFIAYGDLVRVRIMLDVGTHVSL